uniref:Protein kinase domain-containing protein n=1 Tax=Kalanchoe fedtschenkoi TaxID=63787 RepID=A0A7N0URK2_KALFE
MSKPVPVLDSLDHENSEQTSISLRSFSASTSSLELSVAKSSTIPSMTDKLTGHNTSLPQSATSSSKLISVSNPCRCKQSPTSTCCFPGAASHKSDNKNPTALQIFQKQRKAKFRQRASGAPILCATCGIRTELFIKDSMKFSYTEIQQATNDFAKENLLGEGGFGHVYKGELTDGQKIAAKVRKEASDQGFEEFHSEVYVLSFARHKNIVMLLGYCSKENHNILVYEFVCNNSLYWHLYDAPTILEWHHRYVIAIGTAKGLRFLHEECRGGPIIHRDMRPSNILLTHDFVPMLGDFGLAKWKTGGDDEIQHTRILGTLGYLAPEYAESGIVSVRTDVYAFGVVLLQLISGRRVLVANGENQSIRQWGVPLIEKLALHELIDHRLGDLYDTLQLYLMAKTAYLCLQTNPELRPSMGEVRFVHFQNKG